MRIEYGRDKTYDFNLSDWSYKLFNKDFTEYTTGPINLDIPPYVLCEVIKELVPCYEHCKAIAQIFTKKGEV